MPNAGSVRMTSGLCPICSPSPLQPSRRRRRSMGVGAIRVRHCSPAHDLARCFDETEVIRRERKQPQHPPNTRTSRGELIAMYKDHRAACIRRLAFAILPAGDANGARWWKLAAWVAQHTASANPAGSLTPDPDHGNGSGLSRRASETPPRAYRLRICYRDKRAVGVISSLT